MDLGLQGRNAIVAAASRGLGRAVAASLSAEGANVVICSRDRDRIVAAGAEIARTTGHQVEAVQADVTEEGDIRSLMEQTRDVFGEPDILFTNAGGPPPGEFQGVAPAAWMDAFQLNILSTVLLCRAVVPGMVGRGRGAIVCSASINSKHTIDGTIVSNTTRAAVLGFAKSLATELAPSNVRVNVANPGYIKTDRINYLATERSKQTGRAASDIVVEWEQLTPMRRMGEPKEFGDAVAFLCSDRASFITGVALQIDGGFVRSVG